jgi:hypothetical protein
MIHNCGGFEGGKVLLPTVYWRPPGRSGRGPDLTQKLRTDCKSEQILIVLDNFLARRPGIYGSGGEPSEGYIV